MFKLQKAKQGHDFRVTFGSMNTLALEYQDAGKLDLAVRVFEGALKLRKEKLGADHPDTRISRILLAVAYCQWKKAGTSTPLFEEHLAVLKAATVEVF